MDNCSFCSESQKVFCSDCDKSYCVHCGITHHLSDVIRHHTINYVCEECEEENAVKFCENCDQSLCLTCDTKIHNKGKRAQHVKKDISDTVDLKKIANLAFITAAFYDEQFGDDCDTEIIKTRLSDLINDISLKASNNEADKTKITVLMIESKENLQKNQEEDKLVQAMNELKIKNVILFKDSFEELGQSSSNGNLVTISAQDNKRASAITYALKFFEGLECIHIYDTIRNEDLAMALGEKTDLKNQKIFVNLDPVDKKDLETSIFEQQPVVLKEKIIQPMFSPQVSEQETQGDYSLLEMKQFSSFKTPSSIQERSSWNSLEPNSNKTSKMWNAYKSGPSKENIEPNQGNFPVLRFPVASEGTNPKSSANSSFSIEGKRLVIMEAQPLHCVDIRGSSRASEMFQRDLIRFASNGELLIPKETVISRLMEMFQLRSIHDATSILVEAEAKKIVHTTSRKFLDNEPIHYIGMLLNTLTIESLVWAIKSVKNDMMTPTEKLVASRVKECYGLKIDQSSWKQILEFIDSKQTPMIDFHTGRAQKTQAYPIQLRQILDPVTNLDTGALYLANANEDWIPEDQGTVDDTSYEWKSFAMFLEDFFKEEPQSSHDSQEQKVGNVPRWNNSVESVLSRSAYDQEGCLKVTDEIKAIPGGRYGCAQFIKYCGPENLKVLSIGRLTLLVQEALNKGILRYQRTLLVKNTTGENFTNLSGQSGFEAEVLHSLNVERKTKLLSTVKEALLQILMDNPNGIALAQIPSHLKRKLKMNVDFQELGFPKLKNFLSSSTLKNLVVMESVGTNHTNVKLKGPLPRQVQNKLHSNKPNESKRRCGDIDNVPVEPRFTTPRGLEQVNNYINKPTMGNDMWAITETLGAILKQYPAGIFIHELEMRLCDQMKMQINFKELGYSRFYDYLVDQAEHIAAIEAKKGAFIIYPKTNHFWQRGAQQQQTPPHFAHNHNASRFGGVAYQEAGRFTDPKVYQNMMAHHNNGFNTAGPMRNHHYPGSYNNSVNLSDSNNSYLSQNNMSNDHWGKSPNLSSIIASDNKGKVMTPGLARGPRYSGIDVACNLNFFVNSVDDEQNGSNWPLSATQKGAKFSKFRAQEESEDDLRFINELLETGTEKKTTNSFGERSGTLSFHYTPNQSFLKPN